MRILLVVEDFGAIGGIQETVDHLSQEFVALGHQVAIISTPYVTPGLSAPGTSADGPSSRFRDQAVTFRHVERSSSPLA